jgi:hypothetical protein
MKEERMLHQTIGKLSQMKLHTMATALQEQLEQPSIRTYLKIKMSYHNA